MYTEEQYWDLMSRYVSNELSSEEKEEFLHWVKQDTTRAHTFTSLQKIWKDDVQTFGQEIEVDSIQAWEQVKKRLQARGLIEQTPKVIKPIFSFWQIAASLILVCLLGITIYQFTKVKVIQIVTVKGEKKRVTLPDHSQVWMNANSTLTYKASFNERKVNLQGEAFFEVVKNEAKPFLVEAGKTNIQVLGTSFDINTIGHELVKVSVFTGKVSFKRKNNSEDELILVSGEVGSCQHEGPLVKESYSDTNFMFWKTKRLEFVASPMDQVLKTIEKYYGVQFLVKDPRLLSRKVTTSFQEDSINDIVHILESLLDSQITYANQVYIIKSKF